MSELIDCPKCKGLGTHNGVEICDDCGGRGEVAQRQKHVLTSAPSRQTFYRGARINTARKGTKR